MFIILIKCKLTPLAKYVDLANPILQLATTLKNINKLDSSFTQPPPLPHRCNAGTMIIGTT